MGSKMIMPSFAPYGFTKNGVPRKRPTKAQIEAMGNGNMYMFDPMTKKISKSNGPAYNGPTYKNGKQAVYQQRQYFAAKAPAAVPKQPSTIVYGSAPKAPAYKPMKYNYTSSYRRPTGKPGYIKGHGDYKIKEGGRWFPGAAEKIGHWAGAAAGSYVAPGIGTAVGGEIGKRAGQLFAKLSGHGDYRVEHNTLMDAQGRFKDSVPQFGSTVTRYKNKEMIGIVNMTQLFTNNEFPINPGLPQTFPRLSQMAQMFEQYRINGLVFFFVPFSANAIGGTDLAVGQVIMATDYDMNDTPFVNEIEALSAQFSNSGRPFDAISHAVECKRSLQMEDWLLVRSDNSESVGTKVGYDLGIFQLMTAGAQADYNNAGQLWVSYDVTFQNPIYHEGDVGGATAAFVLNSVTNADPFGSSATNVPSAENNLDVTPNLDGVVFGNSVGPGLYLIRWYANGLLTPGLALPLVGTGCVISIVLGNIGGNDTRLIYTAYIRLDSFTGVTRGVSLVGAAVLPGGVTSANLLITRLAGTFYTEAEKKPKKHVFRSVISMQEYEAEQERIQAERLAEWEAQHGEDSDSEMDEDDIAQIKKALKASKLKGVVPKPVEPRHK